MNTADHDFDDRIEDEKNAQKPNQLLTSKQGFKSGRYETENCCEKEGNMTQQALDQALKVTNELICLL